MTRSETDPSAIGRRRTPAIRLRPATLADVPLLRRWDEQPHVLESDPNDDWDWENELAVTVPWRESYIGEVDGRPVGFLQIIDAAREETHYWGEIAIGTKAIDLWLGEAEDLGRGYGTVMMKQAIALCFADPAVHSIVIDPLYGNTRARRFYERLGFQFETRRQFGPDDCAVYRLCRDAGVGLTGSLAPVVQQDPTGCAIACAAVLTGRTYGEVKDVAFGLGIRVEDSRLWSRPEPMRRLLKQLQVEVAAREQAFTSWDALPALALLAIKWHVEKNGAAWHWVVFTRDESGPSVLDPKRGLRANRRTDLGRIKPKWFIEVSRVPAPDSGGATGLPPPPPDYERRMPRWEEAAELVEVAPDVFGRPAQLEPMAAARWRAMQAAAKSDGVQLQLVSAFRSVDRQRRLLEVKLASGMALAEALRFTAYPGFSEHHTGRAVDVGSPACAPVTEAFAETPEFAWLARRAAEFGFALSYGRDNSHGVDYEPWHWCWRGRT